MRSGSRLARGAGPGDDYSLNDAEFRTDENSGFGVQVSMPAPTRATLGQKVVFDDTAARLAGLLIDNSARFEADLDQCAKEAAPTAA